ncbi:hypothetical protein F5050DRAFT_1745790 [Lentinula boryana]|uniref:Uncharacterized protein n=1 Tax=Lentinula boryana TaxID=40481 RepID=A0ABQ8QIH1_9AGAR|nr:hypothetical protein F5050DRAFT_1745790 [Lentinula boryana]
MSDTEREAHAAHNATEIPNPTDKCTVESPLPQSHQILPPENERSSFIENSEDMISSQLSPLQLSHWPSSSASRTILLPYSPSAPASAIHNTTVNQEMPSERDDPNSDYHVLFTCPMMEPLSTGSQQFSTTSSNPLSCSPPPAPRPALILLPSSRTEPDVFATGALTSMRNLLSSLSQDEIPRSASGTEKECYEGETEHTRLNSPDQSSIEPVLPSSSPPGHNIITSSSVPSSSPPQLFSSSPPGPSTTMPMAMDTGRQSPPPAFSTDFEDSGTRWSSEQLMLSEGSEPLSPLLFAQSDDQNTTVFMQLNPLSDDFILDNSDESNSIYHIALPTPSSLIPSSSPGHPSSPISSLLVDLPTTAFSSPPRKRKRDHEEEEGTRSLPGSPVKRPAYALPAPKRSTIASQRRQHKKLATPFKSPLMAKRGSLEKAPMGLPAVPNEKQSILAASKARESHASVAPFSANYSSPSSLKSKRFPVTSRAATQFKSPLSSIGAAKSSPPLVRLTPTIQALERKIQILKRALKVKRDHEEEMLADLTTRWTEAGREVAWEVWELARNDADPCGGIPGGKRSFNENWGWDIQGDEKRVKSEDSWNWGTTNREQADEDATLQVQGSTPKMEDEEARVEYTLGMMLRRLGIDPATLGWDEQEGIFKDP